jgi:hypothetical protein
VVFAQMEKEAAQGALIFHDDTAVRILALLKENSDRLATAQAHGGSTPTERPGMHTTALVVKVGVFAQTPQKVYFRFGVRDPRRKANFIA